MKQLAFAVVLAFAGAGSISAQAPAKPPCGDDVCPTEEAATLKAAYLSPVTSPEQRAKMLAIIAARTSAGSTDWVGAHSEYFAWRRTGLSDEQNRLEDGLRENSRIAAAKRANEEPYEFRKQIGAGITACVGNLAVKNFDQSYAPIDIARQIVTTCIQRATSGSVTSSDAIRASIESGNTDESVADLIRELRRPKVTLRE